MDLVRRKGEGDGQAVETSGMALKSPYWQPMLNLAATSDPGFDATTWQKRSQMQKDVTYLTYTHGALVYALRLGTPSASSCLTWAASQLNAPARAADYKWRLA